MKRIGIFTVCAALAFGGLVSCSNKEPYYYDSRFDLAVNLGFGKPISDVESKLAHDYARETAGDVKSSIAVTAWKYSYEDCYTETVYPPSRYDATTESWITDPPYESTTCTTIYYDLKTVHRFGVLTEWFGSQNMGENSFKFEWWEKNKTLIHLLDLHQRGDWGNIMAMYLDHPDLNTRKNHVLGAVIAAKNDHVKVVKFYMNEKRISPDEKVDAWLTVKEKFPDCYRKRACKVSIRDAARHTNAKGVLELIGDSAK